MNWMFGCCWGGKGLPFLQWWSPLSTLGVLINSWESLSVYVWLPNYLDLLVCLSSNFMPAGWLACLLASLLAAPLERLRRVWQLLGGKWWKGKKKHGSACKIALGNDEEKQNLTALSSAQVNDVQIWQICTQKLGIVGRYLLGVS